MKSLFKISAILLLLLGVSACSNHTMNVKQFSYILPMKKNPLKTAKDLEIEKILLSGTWHYQRQKGDCPDTTWVQKYYTNGYYKSVGAACNVPNAFSVTAENWHVKQKTLYVLNLDPVMNNDIIMRYAVTYLDQNKLVLSNSKFNYTFLRKN